MERDSKGAGVVEKGQEETKGDIEQTSKNVLFLGKGNRLVLFRKENKKEDRNKTNKYKTNKEGLATSPYKQQQVKPEANKTNIKTTKPKEERKIDQDQK